MPIKFNNGTVLTWSSRDNVKKIYIQKTKFSAQIDKFDVT